MEKEYKDKVIPDVKMVYYCDPDLNKKCDKRVCSYNTNAIDPVCYLTTQKEFALQDGQEAEIKAYPPVEKTEF